MMMAMEVLRNKKVFVAVNLLVCYLVLWYIGKLGSVNLFALTLYHVKVPL